MRAFQAARGVHKVRAPMGRCWRVSGCRILLKQAVGSGQGGGGRDDDYVSRSEFRLLLVICTAVRSIGCFVYAVTLDLP